MRLLQRSLDRSMIIHFDMETIKHDRRTDYKNHGPVRPEEALDRRRKETVAFSAQRKESALRSKRMKRDPSLGSLPGSRQISREPSRASLGEAASEGAPPAPLIPPEDVAAEVAAAVEAVKGAKPVGSDLCLDAVRRLRQLLSNYDEPPFKEAVQAGAVPVLVAALQPPRMDATAMETIFEAAWAITNLAVGEFETVKAVLAAAPILIAYLGGGSGLPVAEQCAWALGNIAAEDFDFRQTLIANGVVRPLAQLVGGAAAALDRGADEGDPALSAGTTAAWALSNVVRGAGKEVADVMAVPGAAEAVVRLVAAAPHHLAVEAAWVLAYVTAAHETHLNRMVSLGAVPPILRRATEAVDQMLQDEQDGRALLIPVLRALGNIAAGGGGAACEQLLSPDAMPALKAVVVCAGSHHHGLQREACWVLSSVAGMPGGGGVEALKSAGAVPELMRVLKESPFHVRKEAAFALANICAGGGGGTGSPEDLNWLFAADRDALKAMVSLMRSADMDAARLGLQFTEMVLRLLDTGAEAVEEVDGIDAIEAVQYGAAPPELQRMAAELVDKYYGAGAEE